MATKAEQADRIRKLRAALEPFAKLKPHYPGQGDDVQFQVWMSHRAWRAAREALGLPVLTKGGDDELSIR